MKKEVYIGTYSNDENSGIFRLNVNTKTGEMDGLTQITKTLNPSYIVMNKEKKLVYSVLKDGDDGGVCVSEITDNTVITPSRLGYRCETIDPISMTGGVRIDIKKTSRGMSSLNIASADRGGRRVILMDRIENKRFCKRLKGI